MKWSKLLNHWERGNTVQSIYPCMRQFMSMHSRNHYRRLNIRPEHVTSRPLSWDSKVYRFNFNQLTIWRYYLSLFLVNNSLIEDQFEIQCSRLLTRTLVLLGIQYSPNLDRWFQKNSTVLIINVLISIIYVEKLEIMKKNSDNNEFWICIQ